MTGDVTARLTAALSDRYTIERELGAGGIGTEKPDMVVTLNWFTELKRRMSGSAGRATK